MNNQEKYNSFSMKEKELLADMLKISVRQLDICTNKCGYLSEMKIQKMRAVIKAIYDNGGKTADRYTVYYNIEEKENWFSCLGMDGKPFHPQGIGMHSSGMLGEHNGKRITFDQLPEDCQKAVLQDLKELIK
jgi:hypothetical protein